ncbi:hypothetical protein ASD42_25240 [Nocardia sp. Root136]|uniref:hypothetical protein n=1 Tax=Nocardia sp. Root136 TaxID=1736458 RepID=UPI0006F256DE|nr:hypothetical protein [Nocardia sp. Root136]KQY30566.1 hypothetical protein ASD42_25240 [Nocardia sp. Root136]
MGISIIVQNQMHHRVDIYSGQVASKLSEMALAAPKGSMLGEIHAYADTMFNSFQLNLFLAELSNMTAEDDSEQEVFDTLSRAAEEAIRCNGYLWFSGD